MPVRAIKQIYEDGVSLHINIPESIRHMYNYHGELLCKVVSHFDKKRNLVRKINESTRFQQRDYFIVLSSHPLAEKYGFVEEDYLEIVYQAVERRRKRFFRTLAETIPIFPERMVEDLGDFEDK